MLKKHILKKLVAATALSVLAAGSAWAFPTKPINIVVPYAPGGATDSTARILANALQNVSGNSFIVENVPGAGTTIGANKVAKATADGHTLLFGGLSANVLAPEIYKNVVTFDAKDFEPIVQIAAQPLILVVNSNSAYTSLAELIQTAAAKPGSLNFGSPGNGSAPHLISELFLIAANIQATHIPFKGAAPAMAALMGGEIDFLLDTPTAPMPQVAAGKLKGLGISTTQRAQKLEQIPTMDEQGVKGFEANTWFALFAPKGTPEPVLKTLNEQVNKALQDPEVRARMIDAYLYPAGGSQEDLQRFTDAERTRWTQIIDSKIQKN